MYGKERVNSKKKRLFGTSFIQNDKEKSILFVFYPDNNKRPFLFTVLADVNRTTVAKISVKAGKSVKNQGA